ncbi:dynamin family protein [Caldilinea sp.]|uniref:dynamin family protein n=1 Tax=Caldilinea sp. TaxID=2293560 RepID=UPI001B0C2593|nr:dynamin family protein [Caldilinea sp.]MBO9393959.1 dynamin family protein [Caldilinea sp.]
MQRILTAEQDQILRRERSVLEDLRVLLVRLGATDDDVLLLKRAREQLDELFLLVIVGEFNAGKTAFLNALLGERLLPEGVLPTTSQIQVLRYGEHKSEEVPGDDTVVIHLPVDWLQEINLVDTPGTNAVIQRHQEITEHFIPRSDLVLFVTSAERPFSESERLLLQRIREWGKKIVLVINKIDLIEQEEELKQIVDFVARNSAELLGTAPRIFPISARLALNAKEQARRTQQKLEENDLWKRSRFAALEQYIRSALDAGERLRLKLENPLGIAERLCSQYQKVIANRRAVLKDDFAALDRIEAQLAAHEADMRRDFKYHLSHVDNVLYAMAERGDRFFDETLRIGRVFDLINGEKVRAEFERVVVADTSRAVEQQVSDLIDWMVDRDYRQWRDVMEYLQERATHHADQIVGRVGSSFEMNRQNLLASVGREAQRIVDSYDPQTESLKLAQQVQSALVQTAAVEAGALGLGAILVTLLHTTLLDVTGLLGAGALAALGFYVLPYRRNRLKQELRSAINDLRDQLNEALTRQFERELSDGLQRMREAIAPYTRFVRVEREKLERTNDELERLRRELADLRKAAARALPVQK